MKGLSLRRFSCKPFKFKYKPRKRFLSLVVMVSVTLALATLASLDRAAGGAGSDLKHGISFGFGVITRKGHKLSVVENAQCLTDITYLNRKRYGLTDEILYQKQRVRAVPTEGIDRFEMAQLPESFLGHGRPLYRSESTCGTWMGAEEARAPPIEVQVAPLYPQKDYSHIIFGVATTYERLEDSLSNFSHWLGHTGAYLVAVVVDAQRATNLDRLSMAYRKKGVNMLPIQPWNQELGANEQHFTIIRDLIKYATSATKWVSIVDDDTFFPSLYPVSEALNMLNHSEPHYIGAVSESGEAVRKHGIMAYGGAGVFLSVPLAATLDSKLEECITGTSMDQGDGLLNECISTKTETKLTALQGLHQVDMYRDCSGFYESGRLPLSLHHWKSWHVAPMDKMAKTSAFCGDCFLQRWKIGTSAVLANGYSISVYKDGIDGIDFGQMESTWDGPMAVEWDLGPLRPKLGESVKKSYVLFESERVGDSVRQLYIHKPDPKNHAAEIWQDEVIELLWER